jgi:flagellar assembly factor FliW
VVCAGSEAGGPSANLLAPIVLNLRDRIGMQVIQSESGYSHRYPIFAAAPEEILVCS